MKTPLLLVTILVLGCASKTNTETSADTTQISTITDTTSIVNQSIIDPDIEQDSLIRLVYGNEQSDSIISLTTQSDNYTNSEGYCSPGVLIMTRRFTQNSEEKFDLAWAFTENGETVFSPVQSFDNTAGQGESSVDISTEYNLSDNCSTLAVKEEYEGGDIDLSRSSRTTFFAIDNGVISEILTIQEEDTSIREYYNSGKENENSTSSIAEIEVLSTTTNGYKDIKVLYTSKINGEETSKEEKIYRFQNSRYAESRQ